MVERALSLEDVTSRKAAVQLLDSMWLDDSASEALWLKALSDPVREVRAAAAARFRSSNSLTRVKARVEDVRREG
jgi:hypothetical protein